MLLQRLTSPFFVACWLLVSACTVGAFWRHGLTAGVVLPIPGHWPDAGKTGVSNSERSLLMFVHPRCGCTKAGLRELQELLSQVPESKYPAVTFILLQPPNPHASNPATGLAADTAHETVAGEPCARNDGYGELRDFREWTGTMTEAICRAIPGSQVRFDAGGAEARRFGVTTSGTCLLYSASGPLLFYGGLTSTRGHSGPNRGRDLLTHCLLHDDDSLCTNPHHDGPQHHPTFGCALFSGQDQSFL